MNRLRVIVDGLDGEVAAHGSDRDGPCISTEVRCRRNGHRYKGTLDDVIIRRELPAEGSGVAHVVPASVADSLDMWSRRYLP